ncbi:MAG: ABC transporter permease [Lachnospiraceae bacterium]
MLAELSIRNMKRSLRDYSIYILTLTISFTLVYAFNLICYSPDLMKLSASMEDFREVNKLIAVIIVLVIGWLINYIIRYMLKQRGKEFSVYLLLGMKSRSIYSMFFVENLLLCLASLVMGILFGTLLFQVLSILIMKVFEAEYRPVFSFSLKALGLTAAYAAGMMLLSLLSNSRKLRKMSIYDLMCSDKKSELQEVSKKSSGNIICFAVFFFIGIFGLIFMHTVTAVKPELTTFSNLLISIVSVIVCIYGCYISISPAMVRLFLRGNRKYKGNRIIIFRALAAKMNTMRVTLGNLAVLITLTFLAVQTGMLMKGFLDELFVSRAPFDVMCTSVNEAEDFHKIEDYLKGREGIRETYQYHIYDAGAAAIDGFFRREITESDWGTYMRYSDYAKLRKMLGYEEPVEGGEGYLLHCVGYVKNEVSQQDNTDMIINGRTYQLHAIYTEGFGLEGMNGVYFVIVIPDETALELEVNHTVMAISTVKETTEATRSNVEKLMEVAAGENIHERLSVKGGLKADNVTAVLIVSFTMFYIGLIFACVMSAIMAIQQLADLSGHRCHYKRLSQLGMSAYRIDGIILKQMLLYFAIPLLFSIPISISLFHSIGHIFNSYVNKSMMLHYMIGALIGFGMIYSLYFMFTYLSFVKEIKKEVA